MDRIPVTHQGLIRGLHGVFFRPIAEESGGVVSYRYYMHAQPDEVLHVLEAAGTMLHVLFLERFPIIMCRMPHWVFRPHHLTWLLYS